MKKKQTLRRLLALGLCLSEINSPAMRALTPVLIVLLLSSCGSTRTVYVKVPYVPISSELTADTPQPTIPDNMTWSQSLQLNVLAFSAIGQCNLDKAAIRKIEQERQK
ncbi:Rz1-like lysis system protein LysC [Candidatus Pantoea multigeneris]|uniref:Rz1 lytic protein n=1 Tax=Candidatus Pantoea multigeneris TaxID=2608357 RepID=A0ABX0R5A9_9GAMM|nr:Rz1 lytic protein [Pantoea multigeneris]NIF20277.1 Rz1 lytic protein [Pantoea multigeneris]